VDFAGQRRPYNRGELGDDAAAFDPLATLAAWMQESRDGGNEESNVMALATIDPDGGPAVRYVLCKGVTARGLRFFTNTGSRKGRSLDADPRAAVTFWFPNLERSVRVVGIAEPLPRDAVDEYFASRPRGSRLGAWVSEQTQPIETRAALEARAAEIEADFDDPEPLGAPATWGGYELVAHEVELWQGRDNRLHDRLRFTTAADAPTATPDAAPQWSAERLQP
jgi:pyridoxamine 5'-phosphate oxidase